MRFRVRCGVILGKVATRRLEEASGMAGIRIDLHRRARGIGGNTVAAHSDPPRGGRRLAHPPNGYRNYPCAPRSIATVSPRASIRRMGPVSFSHHGLCHRLPWQQLNPQVWLCRDGDLADGDAKRWGELGDSAYHQRLLGSHRRGLSHRQARMADYSAWFISHPKWWDHLDSSALASIFTARIKPPRRR